MFRKKKRPTQTSELKPHDGTVPDGTTIVADGLYFFVRAGKKHLIISERVLKSQAYPRVVPVTIKTANKIPNAIGKIGFRDGTLIVDITDNRMYLISNSQRRKVVSPDVLNQLGIKGEEAILVSHEEVLLHKGGEDIGRL